MLDGLKALIAVEKLGTVSEAAVQLRLTQSAVSKRLQALEREIGCRLVEKDGRRLRLTREGLELLAKARPLLAELEDLRALRAEGQPAVGREFSIGLADSIAASWGPAVLRKALVRIPGLKLQVHVHRSTLVVENIKLGRYDLGLVTSRELGGGLVGVPMTREEMVLISGRNKALHGPVLTIEVASATWREIGTVVTQHPRLRGLRLEFVESFTAAAQMAREGFGQALVPAGVARSLGFKAAEVISLSPKLHRQIQLVTRKSLLEQLAVRKLCEALPPLIEQRAAQE